MKCFIVPVRTVVKGTIENSIERAYEIKYTLNDFSNRNGCFDKCFCNRFFLRKYIPIIERFTANVIVNAGGAYLIHTH